MSHGVGDHNASRDALAPVTDPAHRALLARYLAGELSGEMVLMYWLKSSPDVDALRTDLDAVVVACAQDATSGAAVRNAMEALAALLSRNYEGCVRIAHMLRSGVDNDDPARSVEEGIAFCRKLFDWSVTQSPESSVALYSLGSAEILESATAEIVALFGTWRIIGRDRDLLEIGCGTGRFQRALSPQVRTITGIDVSAKMIEVAHRRCSAIANITVLQCPGRDLSMFADDSFDLVFAVDSFPYLVQSGLPLVERHFTEAMRVLRRGGDFVILELSYRGDAAQDLADVDRLAAATGFEVRVPGTQALSLWDGRAFHLTSTKA